MSVVHFRHQYWIDTFFFFSHFVFINRCPTHTELTELIQSIFSNFKRTITPPNLKSRFFTILICLKDENSQ